MKSEPESFLLLYSNFVLYTKAINLTIIIIWKNGHKFLFHSLYFENNNNNIKFDSTSLRAYFVLSLFFVYFILFFFSFFIFSFVI